MNILVLYGVRFQVIRYDLAIDHASHNVIYVGLAHKLEDIPQSLPCQKIARPGEARLFDEVAPIIEKSSLVFDHLIAVSEFDLLDAAALRERFNIPGPRPGSVAKVRNKAVMKRSVAAHGILAPEFLILDAWVAGERLDIHPDRVVIVKPLDGASSTNVRKFDSQSQLQQAIEQRQTGIPTLDDAAQPAYSGFEVEEYISGSVIHIDGLTQNGELQIALPSRKISSCLEFAGGSPMASVQVDCWSGMYEWVEQVLKAVEIHSGAFHLEVIDSPDGIVFLEIAHRVGGGRITETFEQKTGIHLSVADIKIQTDPGYKLAPVWKNGQCFAWFVVPGHHLGGKACKVSGHEYLKGLHNLVALNERTEVDHVSTQVTYVETLLPLAGMLAAPTSAELFEILEQLFARITISAAD
jgi:hypothetical protein